MIFQVALAGPVAGAPLEAGPCQIPEGPEGAINRPEVVPEGSRNIRVGHVGLLAVVGEGAVVGRTTEFRPFLPVPVVHHLARAHGVVAVVPEVRHQGTGIPEDLVAVPGREAEAPGGVRVEAGQETGPRGVADGDVAVGPGEGDPRLDEAPDVRSPGLGMAPEGFEVVVQVVADDEEDIGLSGPGSRLLEAGQEQKAEEGTHEVPFASG